MVDLTFYSYIFVLFHQTADPTPRTDRITKDYEKEYPSIEIEGRRTIRKSTDKQKKNIENVKLDGEVRLCSVKSTI